MNESKGELPVPITDYLWLEVYRGEYRVLYCSISPSPSNFSRWIAALDRDQEAGLISSYTVFSAPDYNHLTEDRICGKVETPRLEKGRNTNYWPTSFMEEMVPMEVLRSESELVTNTNTNTNMEGKIMKMKEIEIGKLYQAKIKIDGAYQDRAVHVVEPKDSGAFLVLDIDALKPVEVLSRYITPLDPKEVKRLTPVVSRLDIQDLCGLDPDGKAKKAKGKAKKGVAEVEPTASAKARKAKSKTKEVDVPALLASDDKDAAKAIVKGCDYASLLHALDSLGLDSSRFTPSAVAASNMNKGTAAMGMQNMLIGYVHGKKSPLRTANA